MFRQHPRGLPVIFFTEMWERFGFYTLMAVLVLYMEKEFGWDDARKGNVYGVFLGLVYFIPVLGGAIGDRLLGRRRTVLAGAVCMVAGFASLTFSSADRVPFFLAGLLMIAFGTGILKVNMAVLVGTLYRDNEALRDAGYNIYYMGVNLGAAVAPLAATVIHNMFNSYTLSFAAAGGGMLVAIATFLLGRRSLDAADIREGARPSGNPQGAPESDRADDRQRLLTLGILFTIVIFFWIAFYQNGFALTLFADRSTVRSDILKPETYQFFNPFFIVVLTPLLLRFFTLARARGKEPSSASKIGLGMFVSGFSMLVMLFASLAGGDRDVPVMSPLWLVSSYFVITVAEILVSPMGQSFVSRVAPPRLRGLMMGCWFAATAAGSYSSGFFGRFYSSLPHHLYFLALAAALLFASGLVFLSMKQLNKFTSRPG